MYTGTCVTTMKISNTLICVWIFLIHGAFQHNAHLALTNSPETATDGDLFTLTCSVSSGSVVVIAWLQNNTAQVITQRSTNCIKQPPPVGSNHNISRFNVSCNNTVHRIEFRYDSTRDQGEWRCGKPASDTSISVRSNIFNIGVASPVISTQSSSITTRHTETTSEPSAMTSQTDVASPVTSTRSTQSLPSTTLYTETTSQPGTVTSRKGPVISTQVLPTTTRYTENTLEPGTVTPQKVSTDDSDSDTVYIVAGAVGGGVLLAVVVVGVVCIRRRRQATNQKEEMTGQRNVTGFYSRTQAYQNTANFDMVENELYRCSCDISPINEAENQEDDLILSDAVDIPATGTCTPREQGVSCDVDADHLYTKLKKRRSSSVQQVSDISAEVKKPKKKRPDDPKMFEDVNIGDVYAKPNKR
ncbi:uncharacterized protein [Haliotis asinina]|uniref:uncharacterized protein isoform X2 n=1 Tax=Haliotis asinina TaxID=109174 RepID=UPI003532770E